MLFGNNSVLETKSPGRGQSTHRLLEALFLVQHLPQSLQDFDAQLLLFVHELLGVFDQSEERRRINASCSFTVMFVLTGRQWLTGENRETLH